MMCSVIYDGYFNVVKGSPEYFDFVGSRNLSPLLNIVHKDDLENLKTVFKNARINKPYYLSVRLKNSFGSFKWVFMRIRLKGGVEDDLRRIYANIFTIDDFENNLEKNDTLISVYRSLLDISGEIYFEYTVRDKNIRFYWINKSQDVEIYSGELSEWKNYILSKNYVKAKNISAFEKLCKDITLSAPKFSYNLSDSKIYSDGENVYNIFNGISIYIKNKPYIVAGVLSSAVKDPENSLRKNRTDSLTGFLNKDALINYADELINKQPDFFINIAIIGIDNFKVINDSFGHLFGDSVIKDIADTIAEIVKDKGIIGRFEGDEFVVVFSGLHDNMELRSYLRAMRMGVEQRFKNIKDSFSLTISIGTSKYPTDGSSYNSLFEKADKCLSIAKEKGKNRYIICDEVIDIANIEKKDKKNFLLIESREKNAGLACRIIDILMQKNSSGIDDIIEILGKERDLSRVSVFFGEGLKRIALWGDSKNVYDNAMYIHKGSYLTNFNSNGVFVVHSSSVIEVKNPDVHSDYSAQSIYSAIQCLIYDDNKNINGLISFEKSFQRKSWTENEIYNFTLISHLIGEVLKKN